VKKFSPAAGFCPRGTSVYDPGGQEAPATVHEEMLTGRPRDTSVQKATSDNEKVNASKHHALDITRCRCSSTSCPGPVQPGTNNITVNGLRSCIQQYGNGV